MRPDPHIKDPGPQVNVIFMIVCAVIIRVRETTQMRQQVIRHIGPELGAKFRSSAQVGLVPVTGTVELLIVGIIKAAVDRMHHAVIAAKVNDLAPVPVRVGKNSIGVIPIQKMIGLGRPADRHGG